MGLVRQMEEKDKLQIIQFLEQSGSRKEGIEESQVYILEQEQIKGVMGVQICEGEGLMRSFVVAQDVDKYQVYDFFDAVLRRMKSQGVDKLYLITNHPSSVPFFQLFGFRMDETVSEKMSLLPHYQYAISQQNATVLYTKLSSC